MSSTATRSKSSSRRVRLPFVSASSTRPNGTSRGARKRPRRSRARLTGKQVQLAVETQDKYDRLVAVVYVGDENINAWMVKQGNAWAYRQYLEESGVLWLGGPCTGVQAWLVGRDAGELACALGLAARGTRTGRWVHRLQPRHDRQLYCGHASSRKPCAGHNTCCAHSDGFDTGIRPVPHQRATSATTDGSTTCPGASGTTARKSTRPKASAGSARRRKRSAQAGGRRGIDVSVPSVATHCGQIASPLQLAADVSDSFIAFRPDHQAQAFIHCLAFRARAG